MGTRLAIKTDFKQVQTLTNAYNWVNNLALFPSHVLAALLKEIRMHYPVYQFYNQ